MKAAARFLFCVGAGAIFLALGISPVQAVASLSQKVEPTEMNVGDQAVVTITVQNSSGADFNLPPVEGLDVRGTESSNNITVTNGAFSSTITRSFLVIPTRAGDLTIPAFDIALQDGSVLHAHSLVLHVLRPGATATTTAPTPPGVNPAPPDAVNGAGQATPPEAQDAPAIGPPGYVVPRDPDGRPAKVFLVITPRTTDAYVGQSVPLRVEFYIRLDVMATQDSLPTIVGSDFLINNVSAHPAVDVQIVSGEQYQRATWLTAVSAPRSGDFKLQLTQNTYWTKSTSTSSLDPSGFFFVTRPNLGHQNIDSNPEAMHVLSLPDEGKPKNFSGAIGEFEAVGTASPLAVGVGDPVNLHFTVSGQGNFGYLRCPTLDPDPAWKTYTPSSTTQFDDETRTQGTKRFDQAVIPQKNGVLKLPTANFSYFDPGTKQYVTVPITFADVTVTGTPLAGTTAATPAASAPTVPPRAATEFFPNRLASGATYGSLMPVYRQAWYWTVQGLLLFGLAGVAAGVFWRGRARPENEADALRRRELSWRRAEEAMHEAAQRDDGPAFFLTARHAIQLQLGDRWGVPTEALNLEGIRERDPDLAEALTPLFDQADEVLYSGQSGETLDLLSWDRKVGEILHAPTGVATR